MSLQTGLITARRWYRNRGQVIKDLKFHTKVSGSGMPPLRQRFVEQIGLLATNGIDARNYYSFGLYERSIGLEDKRRYIGDFLTWRHFEYLNGTDLKKLLYDKALFASLINSEECPVPQTLAIFGNCQGSFDWPTLRDKAAIRDWLRDSGVENFVLKPHASSKGIGIISLGARLGEQPVWQRMPKGEELGLDALMSEISSLLETSHYVVQRRIEPHPDLAALAPHVLHTVRVLTYLDNGPKIVGTTLKVGCGNVPIDNFDNGLHGAILAPVDRLSGECGQAVTLVDHLPQRIDNHPVTGVRVTGLKLPYWEDVIRVACWAANKFYVFKIVGWDIGISKDGAILIEGNTIPGLASNQIAHNKGIVAPPWSEMLENEGGEKFIGLGFFQRPRDVDRS